MSDFTLANIPPFLVPGKFGKFGKFDALTPLSMDRIGCLLVTGWTWALPFAGWPPAGTRSAEVRDVEVELERADLWFGCSEWDQRL